MSGNYPAGVTDRTISAAFDAPDGAEGLVDEVYVELLERRIDDADGYDWWTGDTPWWIGLYLIAALSRHRDGSGSYTGDLEAMAEALGVDVNQAQIDAWDEACELAGEE